MEWNWAVDVLVMLLAAPVLWLVGWGTACYFPFRLTAKFYCVIRNPQLSRLLISDRFNRSSQTKTRLEDRNKLPLLSLLYDGGAAVLLVLLWVSGGAHLYQLWRGASRREVTGIAARFPSCLAAILGWMALVLLLNLADYGLGKALHPDRGTVPPQESRPPQAVSAPAKGPCAARNRRELRRFLLWGGVSTALGILFAFLGLNYGLGVSWVLLGLIFTGGGGFLLCSGLRGLLFPERFNLCGEISHQLPSEAQGRTAKELLALADEDLAYAVSFAGGKALIGTEWFYSANTMGQALIRRDAIGQIERQVRKDHSVTLALMDRRGRGVYVPGLTPGEADAIQMFLKDKAPNCRGR